jgi:hypothetical protein
VHFRSTLGVTDALVTFLNRHPNIVHLQLDRNDTLLQSAGSTSPIRLPKLQVFVGDAEFVPQVTKSPLSLRGVSLSWIGVQDDVNLTIGALENCSETLNLLSCCRRGWNLDLLDTISHRLSDLSAVIITSVLIIDVFPAKVRVRSVCFHQ